MNVDVKILTSNRDISLGMSIYDKPPKHGLLFIFDGNSRIFTMNGVKFPIVVYLLDHNLKIRENFTAYPGDPNRHINSGIKYMVEIPL